MKTHQWVGSIFWIMVGIFFAIKAYRLGPGSLDSPGPGFIFFLAALLLIIFGAIDLAVTFKGRSKNDKDEESVWLGVRWQKVLLILVVLSAYVFFLNILGFFISTFLLMIFLFKAVEPNKWWIAIVASIITILASYGIFKIWLGVPFPSGFLGF